MKVRLLCYSIFLLSCCGSCVNPVKPTQYLTQDIKDYTAFKVGSYWIYQDSSNTANRDSIILVYHNLHISTHQEPALDGGTSSFEEFTDTLASSIDGKINGNRVGGENDYYVQYPSWPNGETAYFTQTNGVPLDAWGNMILTNSLESLSVAGQSYKQVKEFTINLPTGSTVISPITNIWWAKNIGVIKKTVSGTTWLLTRYKVVQ